MSTELTTASERLNYARKQAGKTFNELALEINSGVNANSLSTAFARNTIKEVYKNKIIELLHLNKTWVELGEGEMYDGFSENIGYKKELTQVPFEEFMEAKYLPITAQAGYLSSLEGVSEIELQTMLVPREFEKGNYTVVEISGPSMDDGTTRAICDGDKLLVKEWDGGLSQTIPYWQYLFIIMSRDGLVCKQIISHDIESGVITCRSFNSTYPDYNININDILGLFVVKKIVERRIQF